MYVNDLKVNQTTTVLWLASKALVILKQLKSWYNRKMREGFYQHKEMLGQSNT